MNTYTRRKRRYHPDLRKQKVLGLIMIAITVCLLILAMDGQSVMERDATCTLFTLPLGLYMLFSKREVIV